MRCYILRAPLIPKNEEDGEETEVEAAVDDLVEPELDLTVELRADTLWRPPSNPHEGKALGTVAQLRCSRSLPWLNTETMHA